MSRLRSTCFSLLAQLDSHAAEQELRTLDSSVKRNTALIKKLRLINEDTKDALLADIRRANQTKVRFWNNC